MPTTLSVPPASALSLALDQAIRGDEGTPASAVLAPNPPAPSLCSITPEHPLIFFTASRYTALVGAFWRGLLRLALTNIVPMSSGRT